MKKCLLLSLILTGLAVIFLPAAQIPVDSGKDRIVISKEVPASGSQSRTTGKRPVSGGMERKGRGAAVDTLYQL